MRDFFRTHEKGLICARMWRRKKEDGITSVIFTWRDVGLIA